MVFFAAGIQSVLMLRPLKPRRDHVEAYCCMGCTTSAPTPLPATTSSWQSTPVRALNSSSFQPRTEAFSAVPVGAQAYFNSQAGVGTLAVIPGGIATASSISATGKKGAAAGGRQKVVQKRGWHTRNK